MAGTQNIGEPSDNPVALNVTAIVDIVFCLCLFFMCSLHFKQLEGRIETWLPREGTNPTAIEAPPVIDEIRVTLKWDSARGRTVRKVGAREVATDLDFQQALLGYPKAFKLKVAIDATYDVPWADAVRVLDLCKRNRFEKITFVEPFEGS